MKKQKICLFDLVLLLLVAALGIGVYSIVHTPAPAPPNTPEELLEDLHRLADRTLDEDALQTVETYNILYTVYLEDVDEDQLARIPQSGDALFENYGGTQIGTLDSVQLETVDGHTNLTLRIAMYALFTKTAVTSPATYPIRVGTEIPLRNEDGAYIGLGLITWISH